MTNKLGVWIVCDSCKGRKRINDHYCDCKHCHRYEMVRCHYCAGQGAKLKPFYRYMYGVFRRQLIQRWRDEGGVKIEEYHKKVEKERREFITGMASAMNEAFNVDWPSSGWSRVYGN